MGNFLTLALRDWTPPVVPTPPGRIAHLADDTPFDFRVIDSGTGVGGGLACEADLAVQFGGGFRGLEGDLKFGPLVFLNIKGGTAARAGGYLQAHVAQYPITRGIEFAAERTVVVGPMLLAADFFTIAVAE